jgi:hypothetical protein
MGGGVACTRAINITYIVFVGKPEGEVRHVKPGNRWNISKTGFKMSTGSNGALVELGNNCYTPQAQPGNNSTKSY